MDIFNSPKYRLALPSIRSESVGFSASSKGFSGFDKTFHPRFHPTCVLA